MLYVSYFVLLTLFTCKVLSGMSLPLIVMHTRVLMTYLLGGHLPCRKCYMVFFKIKVNACILIHPNINYKFFGNYLEYPILLILPKKIGKKIAIQTMR